MIDYKSRIIALSDTFQKLLEADPRSGINACRKIAELILASIYQDIYGPLNRDHIDFDKTFNKIKESDQNPITRKIEIHFSSVQKLGNLGSHETLGEFKQPYRIAENIQPAIIKVIHWFFNEYLEEKHKTIENRKIKPLKVNAKKPNYLFILVLISLSLAVLLYFLEYYDVSVRETKQSVSDVINAPIKIDWIKINSGVFEMGADDGEADEAPVHTVSVPSFELSRAEITVAEYTACVDAGRCAAPWRGEGCNWGEPARQDHPINCINQHDALSFARWVGGRLPTEAEWEYAARGRGRAVRYPWGAEAPTCERAVFSVGGVPRLATHGCDRRQTWPVCAKPKGTTPEGLCDMAGNLWEWVEGEKCPYPSTPRGAEALRCGANHGVLRGGSWANHGDNLRVSDRLRFTDKGNQYVGFRVAR
ncbi:formylglycine-generating enzyme family protein [Myxococcota bacterium]|nr:formylglycine-generating enzyme family protein [Myxococcota bacterium]